MNILYINNNYINVLLHRKMVEHLNEAGAQISVYVPVFRDRGADVTTKGREVVVSPCLQAKHRFFFQKKQAKIVEDVKKRYDMEKFDCIHTNTLFVDGNCANELYKEFGIPFVTAVRDTDMHAYFQQAFWLRKKGVEILRNAAAVFFLSEAYRTELINTYIPKKYRKEILKKSYLIPNGIDDFWLENRNVGSGEGVVSEPVVGQIAKKEIKIIFVGAICERKNPLAVQEALKILRTKGWNISFTMVGKTKDEKLLEKTLAYPNTTYIEHQSKEVLCSIYRKHTMLVLPSKTETFGLVYAEAMSQGLPVIYTKGQGFDTQFSEGEVGYHVVAKSPQDIANAIEKVCANYEQIAKNCTEQSLKFKWKDICTQYVEIYEHICH